MLTSTGARCEIGGGTTAVLEVPAGAKSICTMVAPSGVRGNGRSPAHGDGEVAQRADGDGRRGPVAGCSAVNAELRCHGGPASPVLLRIHTPATTVLIRARPGDDEAAGRIHGHGRSHLVAGRRRVDLKL